MEPKGLLETKHISLFEGLNRMSSIEVSVRCKSGKVCPLCHLECLKPFETICNRCWNFLGKIDRATGTTYQQQIKDNKRVVIALPKIIYKIQTCYYPLTPKERRERIRKIIVDVCLKCTKKAGMGFEDPCWSCLWRTLMNEIQGNEQ